MHNVFTVYLHQIIFSASYEGEENAASVQMVTVTPILNMKVSSQLRYEEAVASSAADIEYTMAGGNTHTIHHSGHVKRECSDEVSTYSLKFELMPTQFTDMALDVDLKTVMSPGRLESTGKVARGPVTWNFEKVWSCSSENNHHDFKVHMATVCPYHGIDYLVSTEFKTGRQFIYGKSLLRLAPEKEYSISVELNRNQDFEMSGLISTQLETMTTSHELLINKVADGHYTAQVSSRINQ